MKNFFKSIILDLFPDTAKSYVFRNQKNFSWKTLDLIDNEPEVLILEEIFSRNTNICFFDVGANKGEYVYAATKFLDPDNIRAFEPNPKLAKKLRKLFPEIHVHEVALSNENAEAVFRIPTINGNEDDTLGSLANKKLENETSSELIEVSCRRLDSFSENFHLFPDVIKIDVEGFELMVLEGGAHTISKSFPLLLIEVEKRHHKEKTLLELFERIKTYAPPGQHYKVFYFNVPERALKEVLSEPMQLTTDWGSRKYINNFFFVPSGSAFLSAVEAINNKLKTYGAKE